MRRALLVAGGFFLVTLLLAWGWEEAGLRISYKRFLEATGRPILDLVGLDDVRIVGGRTRYINWIPFVGLILVTPGLSLSRRGVGLAAGLAALYASHLLLNATAPVKTGRAPLVPSLVSDTLPFLLWFGVAHPVVRGWFGRALASARDPDAPVEVDPPA